jgi:peptide/nickel transport system substrate-binding protein
VRRGLAAALTGAAALGALVITTPSAAAPASREPTLTVAIPGPFGGCNPGSTSTTAATDEVLSLVLPSAFTPGSLSTPVGDTPVVAQAEVVSLNPQTVVYTIAPGATWPDGAAFGAEDLVRTWQERRADALVADLGYRDVASMTPNAAGTTLTVVFSTPYSDWESLFNLIVPESTTAAACSQPTAALDPSMGPYAITSATSTTVTLEANKAWTGTLPFYTHVVVTTDPSDPVPEGGAPRLVYLPSPTLAQLEAITSTGAFDSRIQHDTTIVSLDFAVRGPEALPLDAREAVARFIDRTAIVNTVAAPIDDSAAPAASHLFGQGDADYLGAPGTPVGTPVAPAAPLPGASGSAAYGDVPDVATADALLHAAGYAKSVSGWREPGGRPFSVCLGVPDQLVQLVGTAAMVRDQLLAQGVEVEWRPSGTVASVVDDLRAGTCAAGLVSRTGDGFATHEAAIWLAAPSPVPMDLTWTGVDDPIVNAAALTATSMLNPLTAVTTWTAMDARLWNLMVGLPLYSPSVYVGWTPQVAGLLPCSTVGCTIAQIPSLVAASPKP